jgi:hypothetical protein
MARGRKSPRRPPVEPLHSPRYRARNRGAYRRTTLCLPTDVFARMTEHIKTRPGLTVSAYVSEVLAAALAPAASSGS